MRGTPHLFPPIRRELYAVVRDILVDLTVLVSFGLGMTDQNDHLRALQVSLQQGSIGGSIIGDILTRGFPMVATQAQEDGSGCMCGVGMDRAFEISPKLSHRVSRTSSREQLQTPAS